MKNMELRFNDFNMIQDDQSGKLIVSGYVNETGKYSHLLGKRKKFKEKIQKGAFTRALANGNDVHFLAEHDDNKILASTRNNSLKLVEDETGLLMTAEISDTSYGRDYHTLIKDGILRNMSFGFSVDKDKWKRMNDGTYTREITDLTLYEVSVVTNPAYPQSTISARGIGLIAEEVPDDIDFESEDKPMEKTKEVQVEETKAEEQKVEEIVESTEEKETTKVEEVVEETKEKDEKRAYVSGIWDDRDILNTVLDIIANVSTLLQHNKKAQEKILSPEVEKGFGDVVATCSEIIVGLNQTPQPEVTPVAEIETVSERSEEVVEEIELPEEVRKLQERFNNL